MVEGGVGWHKQGKDKGLEHCKAHNRLRVAMYAAFVLGARAATYNARIVISLPAAESPVGSCPGVYVTF